jgi:hypothetical protein
MVGAAAIAALLLLAPDFEAGAARDEAAMMAAIDEALAFVRGGVAALRDADIRPRS